MGVPLYQIDYGRSGMRNIWSFILTAGIILSLAACESDISSEEKTSNGTEPEQSMTPHPLVVTKKK